MGRWRIFVHGRGSCAVRLAAATTRVSESEFIEIIVHFTEDEGRRRDRLRHRLGDPHQIWKSVLRAFRRLSGRNFATHPLSRDTRGCRAGYESLECGLEAGRGGGCGGKIRSGAEMKKGHENRAPVKIPMTRRSYDSFSTWTLISAVTSRKTLTVTGNSPSDFRGSASWT